MHTALPWFLNWQETGWTLNSNDYMGWAKICMSEVFKADNSRSCRVYAPVGNHEDLLPYLVRRPTFENGANTSFVNRIMDEKLPVEQVAEDPIHKVAGTNASGTPGNSITCEYFCAGTPQFLWR